MRIVAVIPAKGYSSRLPEKNFRPFYQGRSLLEIKIEQCLASRVFDAVYVSSDAEPARRIAETMGTSFVLRDSRLCRDDTPWYEVLTGILNSLPEAEDAWIAWCPVTSPLFRRYAELLEVLQKQLDAGLNSIATLTPLKHYYLDDRYLPINHQWGPWAAYSQRLPLIYQLNMACHVAQKKEMKLCGFHLGSRPTFFHTETWEGLDIDTLEEFELAQWYYERYFGKLHG